MVNKEDIDRMISEGIKIDDLIKIIETKEVKTETKKEELKKCGELFMKIYIGEATHEDLLEQMKSNKIVNECLKSKTRKVRSYLEQLHRESIKDTNKFCKEIKIDFDKKKLTIDDLRSKREELDKKLVEFTTIRDNILKEIKEQSQTSSKHKLERYPYKLDDLIESTNNKIRCIEDLKNAPFFDEEELK